MKASVAVLVFALLWCSTQAALVRFNSSLADECADGCNFLNETIWEGGLAPVDGDDVEVVGEALALVKLYLSGATLTNISLSLDFAELAVDSMSSEMRNVTLQSASSLVLNSTALVINELLSVSSSSISVHGESSLNINSTTSYFFLDTNSTLSVADTSLLSSSAASWLHGDVRTSGSAVLAFFLPVTFAGNNTFESDQYVEAVNVTLASNVTFPSGLDAQHVEVSENVKVSVHTTLLISGSLSLGNDSIFTIASVEQGQILAETNNGAVYGAGTLEILSSSVVIAPPGFHDDGNYTDFQGTLVLGGATNLSLALFFFYDVTFTNGVAGEAADVLLNAFSVHFLNPVTFQGEIFAYRFDDYLDSITVFAPLTLTRCITSSGASMTLEASVSCGPGHPFIIAADADDKVPVVNVIGFGTTIEQVTISASSFQITNASFYASGFSDLVSTGNIEFVDCDVAFQQAAGLLTDSLTFNGNNTVALVDESFITFSNTLVLGGTSTINLYQTASIAGAVATSSLSQAPGTALNFYGSSQLNNPGSSEFGGHLQVVENSQLTLNNAAFTGSSVFNTTGQIVLNGQVIWSGVHDFPSGLSFGAGAVLKNGTTLQVWTKFTSNGPLVLEGGSTLILQDCEAYFKCDDNHPALSGAGILIALTSVVDFDAVGNNYTYSDFEGVLAIGGQSTWTPLLFTFNFVQFVSGTAGEPANVTLDAYGVRFNSKLDWPGALTINPAVESYPSLEVHAPITVWSVLSKGASTNITSTLTSTGDAVFTDFPPYEFESFVWAGPGSNIVAPSIIFESTAYFVATGVSHLTGNVVNTRGSNITIDRDAHLIITGDYSGSDAIIAYNYLETSSNASAPINVTNVAYLNGTTAWYSTLLEEGNTELKQNLDNVPVLEAKSVYENVTFDHVYAGTPMGARLNISSSIGTNAEAARDIVYITNRFTPAPAEDKPIYKQWWFWFIIILVVCAILGAVAFYMRNRKRSMYTPLEM